MPFRLFQPRPRPDGQPDQGWTNDPSERNGLSPIQALLIVAAAAMGIGGAAVGLIALRSSHPHSSSSTASGAEGATAEVQGP